MKHTEQKPPTTTSPTVSPYRAKENTEILISGVTVGARIRKDAGDLSGLESSLKEVGLINPILVDKEHQLICGHRRWMAAKSIGWETIPALVSNTGADTLEALRMESAENEHRKPFTPSEAVAMKKLIEGQIRAEAAERKREHGGTAPGRPKNTSVEIDGSVQNERQSSRESRTKIARAVGMGQEKLGQATKVVEKGAPELIDSMDKGEVSVNRAAKIAELPKEQQPAAIKNNSIEPPIKPKARRTRINISEDAMNEPDSPLSARVIGVRIRHDMKSFRLSDPNTERVLLEIKSRIDTLLEELGNRKQTSPPGSRYICMTD